MRILFVTSEMHPLVKTGGLADVSGSLPRALQAMGHQARVLLPGYRGAMRAAAAHGVTPVATIAIDGHVARVLETRLSRTGNRIWLLDCPALFDRDGDPYRDGGGREFPDNAERFWLLCRVAALLARDAAGIGWRPDLVHCNDWQTALVPLLLHEDTPRPALVFTIHNLAYQGVFDAATFARLGIAQRYWHYEALEFHGRFSFIKGGLVYADRITTVSPTYAREICTPAFGEGLDGLLRHRGAALRGILNGIDTDTWNPARDPALALNYSSASLARKRGNKVALQAELGLDPEPERPLLAFIGRLVEQKGIDLLRGALPSLLARGAQAVILGSGDADHQLALTALSAQHTGTFALRVGYDEALAHRIEAAADLFLMPSRFEPCGLNQMYSLRYGTLPVVHAVGGLADTVVDTTPATLADGSATGFVFHDNTPAALESAALRAIAAWRDAPTRRALQLAGMRRDLSWRNSAREYLALYDDAIAQNHR